MPALAPPRDDRRLVGHRRRWRLHLVREVLETAPDVEGLRLREWAVGEHLWLRRTAIICQVGRKDRLDQELLAGPSSRTSPDQDFFIRKAVGWALRDHSRVAPDWVRAFVGGPRRRPVRAVQAGSHATPLFSLSGPSIDSWWLDAGIPVAGHPGQRLHVRSRAPAGSARATQQLRRHLRAGEVDEWSTPDSAENTSGSRWGNPAHCRPGHSVGRDDEVVVHLLEHEVRARVPGDPRQRGASNGLIVRAIAR